MANLHACCVVIASLLISFVFPSCSMQASSQLPSPHSLSFQLHLHHPSTPLNLHNCSNASTHPLIPYLFSHQPLFHFDKSSQADIEVGSAHGVYLAAPAASMELPHIFCTVTLQRYQEVQLAQFANEEAAKADEAAGSLVLMGSLASGAVSVVGGTRNFAWAMGQAKVSMAPGGSNHLLIISFEVELVYEQTVEAQDPIIPETVNKDPINLE